jgi:hypothetical protein
MAISTFTSGMTQIAINDQESELKAVKERSIIGKLNCLIDEKMLPRESNMQHLEEVIPERISLLKEKKALQDRRKELGRKLGEIEGKGELDADEWKESVRVRTRIKEINLKLDLLRRSPEDYFKVYK